MATNPTARQKLWDQFTRPHHTITDELTRREARTLSVVTLVLTITGTIASGLISAANQSDYFPMAVSLSALFLVVYILSRSRFVRLSSVILVVALLAGSFTALITLQAGLDAPILLSLLLPMLAAVLLLPVGLTIAVLALELGGLIVLVAVAPWLSFSNAVVPLVALGFISTLVVTTALVRRRDMEQLSEQTGKMDSYSTQLERDVERITAVSDLGRLMTRTRDLDSLLTETVDLIQKRFGFYHVQVFLLDEAGDEAVLAASTGEAGKQLLARKHKLAVGSQSVIGQVTDRNEPVIASDTDVDPVHRRNELLPNTRAEMALPLAIAGRVIGALDVQSVEPNAFGQTEISIFQTMADQLAISIENARLFDRARRDLQDIERLNRQLTGEAWREYLEGRPSDSPAGYRAGQHGVQKLSDVDRDEVDGAFSVPLKVRGETIGMLDVTPSEGQPPDEDTQHMIEAVAERVAMALDSTRLSEQTQRQALREQIFSQLSAELQATTDLEVMLRIAAREASHALGTPRSFVHLSLEYGVRSEAEGAASASD